MNRLANQAIKQGRNFTPLANTKFEVMFKAYDRNNEVQYRLLFTPLAQQNMLEILTGKAGFGDDLASTRNIRSTSFVLLMVVQSTTMKDSM